MRWPAYEKMYISAFERMLEVRKKKGLDSSTVWANITTGEEMFHWWMEDDILPGQVSFDDIEEAMNAEI
jgi:phosphoadenosine phosphosulfate reductase